jgi:hypothetical protein
MPSQEKVREFVAWTKQHVTDDEKGEAQTFSTVCFRPLIGPARWVHPG